MPDKRRTPAQVKRAAKAAAQLAPPEVPQDQQPGLPAAGGNPQDQQNLANIGVGFDKDVPGNTEYFESISAAIILVKASFLTCHTWCPAQNMETARFLKFFKMCLSLKSTSIEKHIHLREPTACVINVDVGADKMVL